MNSIVFEVEISILGGANGIPSSFFDPNHPFVHPKYYRPLSYWNNFDNFHNKVIGSEIYWVIQEELSITPPAMDLQNVFKCFNMVPSVGAKYSIKLCADVPNNDKPTELPPQTGSETGHTFVVVTKSNGSSNVVQVFGFYAQKHPGYINPFRSLPSTIKDNQLREINASIEMSLTEAQFEILRTKALTLAKQKYDANDYNCTNYGLDLFNSVRTKPLTIDSYTVYIPSFGPSVNPLIIDKTPQMLFKKLHEMKKNKDPEDFLITIDQTNNTKAPVSHGECN